MNVNEMDLLEVEKEIARGQGGVYYRTRLEIRRAELKGEPNPYTPKTPTIKDLNDICEYMNNLPTPKTYII